jgi:hypothetical protein
MPEVGKNERNSCKLNAEEYTQGTREKFLTTDWLRNKNGSGLEAVKNRFVQQQSQRIFQTTTPDSNFPLHHASGQQGPLSRPSRLREFWWRQTSDEAGKTGLLTSSPSDPLNLAMGWSEVYIKK